MDLGLRNDVRAMFEEKAEKYALDDITYNSFTASFGYRNKFCAADVVYAIIALLEYQKVSLEGFQSFNAMLILNLYVRFFTLNCRTKNPWTDLSRKTPTRPLNTTF